MPPSCLGRAPFVVEVYAVKVCSQPGCPELVDAGTCSAHTRDADRARGTRQERGYGRDHDRLRAELLPQAYGQPCPMCSHRMWPHDALALDHTEDRTAYRGIVHASCNNRDGAARGNRERGGG